MSFLSAFSAHSAVNHCCPLNAYDVLLRACLAVRRSKLRFSFRQLPWIVWTAFAVAIITTIIAPPLIITSLFDKNRRLSILVYALVGPDGFQIYGADLLDLWRRQDSAGHFVHNNSQSSRKRGHFGAGYDASATLSMGNKTGAVEDSDVWVGSGRDRSDFLEQVGQTTICEKPQGRECQN